MEHTDHNGHNGHSPLYLLERSEVGVVQLNRELKVVAMNSFARRVLPVDDKQPFDKVVLSFHPERSQPKVQFLLDQAECPVDHPPAMTMIINIPERVLLIRVSKLVDVAGATTGYALSRFNFPGRRQLMFTFLVTQMFPMAILIVPIYVIMANLGLINTLTSLVIAYLTVAIPFCAWMLKGYFDTISTSLDEAAAMDGAGPFGIFWRIILPLARPGLAVTAFFTFLTAWGEVAYASAFIQTDSRFTLAYGLQQFVPAFNPQWEYLTAAAVLITIPAGFVFFFAQRHLVSGLSAGGTKG